MFEKDGKLKTAFINWSNFQMTITYVEVKEPDVLLVLKIEWNSDYVGK